MWVRESTDPLGELKVFHINGRPDPSTRIRNRIAFRVVDVGTGLVQASDTATAETFPFRGLPAISDSQTSTDGATASIQVAQPLRDLDGLGLSVSWLAGSGVSYRHWFANVLGVQVAGIPWFQPRNNSLTGFVNLGLAGMGTMFHGENFRVFWLTGYGVLWTQNYVYASGSPDAQGKTTGTDTLVNTTNHGVAPGIGVDFLLTRNIGLHAAVAYTVAYKVRPADVPNLNYDAGWSLSPGGQLGAYFYY